MDNEARKIARHHLGDTLTHIMRGGPHAADWIVFARHGTTEVSARAATVDAAAAACTAQLRAAGWSPSHARLEWRSNRWQHHLHLCIDRLSPELLFAAQPVVEWCTRIDVEEATVGAFALLVESDGWRLEVSDGTGDYWIVDSGDETGPAGKSAAEAAYRRACGFPPQAAPVAPQVVRLHQAYEGTTTCLHCGKPMPWSEMEVCPRDSGFPTAPPCAG